MITSNSQIFTTEVFGVSSGDITANLSEKNRTTQEQYLQQSTVSNMGTSIPTVPSNQIKLRD